MLLFTVKIWGFFPVHPSDNSCYKEHLTTRLVRSLYTAFSFTTGKHIKLLRLEFISVSNIKRNILSTHFPDTALSSSSVSKRTHLRQPANPTAFETQAYPKVPVKPLDFPPPPPFFLFFFWLQVVHLENGKTP